MKGINLLISMIMLSGCALLSNFNANLASQNMSLVKEVHYSSFHRMNYNSMNAKHGYYSSVILHKINEKQIVLPEDSYRTYDGGLTHKIIEGENELFVECHITNIYSDSINYMNINNTQRLKVTLKKGHTYFLISMYVRGSKTNDDTCTVNIDDITTI